MGLQRVKHYERLTLSFSFFPELPYSIVLVSDIQQHRPAIIFAQLCLTLCNHMDCSMLGFPVLHPLSELAQIRVHQVVMPSNHLILCHPLLLLPSIFPSIWVFSNESVLCIRWPKYCSSASASVLPMNIQDWFPLGWTDRTSLQSKGLSRVFSNTTVQNHQFFGA